MRAGAPYGIREIPDVGTYSAASAGPGRPGQGRSGRRVGGESQRRSAHYVEREMGAHVETGQLDQGDGGQREGAGPSPGQGGGARGDGDGRVPGQVPEPGGVLAAAADPGQ
jgi:hypothetical protein